MNALRRIGLWLGSVFLSVSVFSLLLSRVGSVSFIFRITMMFALPVAFLYLPIVIALKDAAKWRPWTILFSGTLIGPAVIATLSVIQQLRGGDAHEIWQGDGIGLGAYSAMICVSVVGFLTTTFFVIAMKVTRRGSEEKI